MTVCRRLHVRVQELLLSACMLMACPVLLAQFPAVTGSLDQLTLPQRPQTQQSPTMVTVPQELGKARLGPGYLVQMDIFGVPEMAAILRVDGDGRVTIPVIGVVTVAGMTTTQAALAIAGVYIQLDILKDPQISLRVLEYAVGGVSVVGEVQQPGRIPLLSPRPLSEVLALAGGETNAAGDTIEIDRLGSAPKFIRFPLGSGLDLLRQVSIQNGDFISVKRAGVVYVLGAVTRPGGYLMVDGGGLNLLQAISLAQGTSIAASVGTIYVIRPGSDGTFQQLSIEYKNIIKGKAQPIALKKDDIVYVPTSAVKSILINGATLIGIAGTAVIYRVP